MPYTSRRDLIPRLGAPAATALLPLLACLALAFGPAACSGGEKKAKAEKAPVPVSVAKVQQRTVPMQIKAIGNVEAYSTVEVRSMINGAITKVHIKDGDEVGKGDMLFTLDPRPYEAALAQAKAQLEKDQVLLRKAEEDMRRYTDLVEKQVISREAYDQTATNADSLRAQIRLDQAMVEKARIDLDYCYIRSPFNGKAGTVLNSEGNVVKANADTAMLVIYQINPIYVNFAIPEDYLTEVQKRMAEGRKLLIQAYLSDSAGMMEASDSPMNGEPETGELSYVDNTVDKTTGTIKLKATFENKKRRLWPGRFVRVALNLADRENALLVDARAVQAGQNGQFVYVVGPGNVVQASPVTTLDNYQGYSVIGKGLAPGQTVVVDGQLRLTPNATVSIRDEAQANATKASPGNQQQPKGE